MVGLNGGELMHLFVDDLTDYAIVVVDNSDKILAWNAGAQALLGYAADEAVGRSFSEFYSKLNPEISQYHASIADAVQIGRHETNRQLVRKNGTRFQANIVLRSIFDASKSIVGFGLIAHDIDRSRRIAA